MLAGYSLSIGIFLVPSGRLGDIYGRSTLFVVGLSIFTLASLLVGLSTNALMLNIMRLIQGLGSGLLSPQTTGLILEYFSGNARAKAFSLIGLVISISVAIGPILSGALISSFGAELGWRLSFAINMPIGLVAIILAFRWLPFGKERRTVGKHKSENQLAYEAQETESGTHPYLRKKKEKIDIDPVGMLLLAFSVLGIMLPFVTEAPVWKWAVVGAGFGLAALWVSWEKNYAKRGRFPMVNLKLFKIRTYAYSASIVTIQFLGTTSIFAILAIFLHGALEIDALHVGLITFFDAAASGIASVLAGRYSYQHGRGMQVFALVLIILGILGTAGAIWITLYGVSYWWITVPMIIMGAGQGTMGPANQTQAMLDVPKAHGGTAGGILQTGQRMATAIGNALVTAVFFSVQSTYGTSPDGWYFGIYAAFGVIAIITVIALVISIVFWREKTAHSQNG
ncbi:MFS transporter [Arcanobacterium hippocoleae]